MFDINKLPKWEKRLFLASYYAKYGQPIKNHWHYSEAIKKRNDRAISSQGLFDSTKCDWYNEWLAEQFFYQYMGYHTWDK